MKTRLLIAVSGSVLALGACNKSSQVTTNATDTNMAMDNGMAPNGMAEAGPLTAQGFANTAAASDRFEIESSKLAEASASSAAVKKFAAQMIKAHTESTAKLKSTLSGLSPAITPDDTLTPEQQATLDSLKAAKGAAFDTAYALAQVRDLIDRYQPDVLWNDIGWPDLGLDDLPGLFADYRAAVPDGVVNDRWDGTHSVRPSVSYDFLTSEYQANRGNEGDDPWENCRGVGYSFGFNQAEGPAHCLSPAAAVRLLADVVSRGGNLLLNVGPRSDGTLPPRQRAVLEGMASWMAVNSVAIHDTRPLAGAQPGETPWLRWTRAGDHAYALVADATGEVLLPHPAGLIAPVRLDGEPITAHTVSAGTVVSLGDVGPLPVVIRFRLSA